MHMEYEVRLPDHDFVVASKHKLVLSVYVAREIQTTYARSQLEISHTGPFALSNINQVQRSHMLVTSTMS